MKTTKPSLTQCVALALVWLTLPWRGEGADQFAQVTDPGWVNANQWSWGGVWGDYDNDGFIDLFVPNATYDWTGSVNFLYRNNGNGTFTEKSAEQVGPMLSDEEPSICAFWADVNNDGLLDLIVRNFINSATSPAVTNRLYLNQGNGAFRSVDAGDFTKPTYSFAWGGLADYDNDGVIDIFVCAAYADFGHQTTNLLYHGQGDGTFRLVTNTVVVTDRSNTSGDTAWGDFDNDGWPDLLVANAFTRNFFYHNDGQGRFTRLTSSIRERPNYASIHDAWADYDNDGLLDLASGTMTSTRLFRNNGTGDFVVATNWPSAQGSAPVWGDYDNDGYLDLLVGRGQNSPIQLQLLHNSGDGTFSQVEEVFTLPEAYCSGGGWADYDNDGFLDLFASQSDGQNVLYHNLGNSNHWIKFQLQGTKSNRSALGAKVRVKATLGGKTLWQMREVSAGDNYMQTELRPNFGLGNATNVDLVRIEWPSGIVQELTAIPVNQFLTIWEPPALKAAIQADGACHLTVTAQPNRAWRIEASADLKSWQKLDVFTSTNASFGYTDSASANMTRRLYRVVAE